MLIAFFKKSIKKILYGKRSSSESYIKYLKKNGCQIGKGTFIYDSKNAVIDGTSLQYIQIGENVQLAPKVTILAHDYSYSILSSVYKDLPRRQGKTVIGNNVFVGMHSVILMGSNIGDNVIIGAGSIVKGNIEGNSVYAGNPAKKICTLQDYYEKCIAKFEESARIYIEGHMYKSGELPDINKLGLYKSLFLNADISIKPDVGIKKNNIEEIKKNMKARSRYKNIEEFLEATLHLSK